MATLQKLVNRLQGFYLIYRGTIYISLHTMILKVLQNMNTQKVLKFLKLSNEVPMNFPLYNKSKSIKNETVTKLTNYASSLKKD